MIPEAAIEDVIQAASDVVASDDADIIMGSHISAVRVALRKVVAGRIPYIYTPVYEGGERTPGVMAIGETPRAQWRPAIEWLANVKKAARWYLIGSDYVWPWLSHRAIKKYIAGVRRSRGRRRICPDGRARSQRAHRADPRRKARRCSDFADRHRQHCFQSQPLPSRAWRRKCFVWPARWMKPCCWESAPTTPKICSAHPAISWIMASRENDAFRCQYEASFGRYAPPPGSVGQSNYEGLRFLDAVASRAGSLAFEPLLSDAINVDYHGARGRIAMRRGSASMPIYLAEADGLDFRMIKRF